MKIILSRKGFDTSNGGIPSPIMPDGTLLSMPIPSDDSLTFDNLKHGENSYKEILNLLFPKGKYNNCHLDPDIREDVRIKPVSDWKPAFGQIGAAQSYLKNNNVHAGDLFLFFGRFQQTIGSVADRTLAFDRSSPIIHIIYGYMEIGDVIFGDKIADLNYNWHPHGYGDRMKDNTNAMYIPSKILSFDKKRLGFGVFDYDERLVLTLSNKTATWKEVPALMPNNIVANRKNNAKGLGIYYQGVWQEMVLKENNTSQKWAESIFLDVTSKQIRS